MAAFEETPGPGYQRSVALLPAGIAWKRTVPAAVDGKEREVENERESQQISDKFKNSAFKLPSSLLLR